MIFFWKHVALTSNVLKTPLGRSVQKLGYIAVGSSKSDKAIIFWKTVVMSHIWRNKMWLNKEVGDFLNISNMQVRL